MTRFAIVGAGWRAEFFLRIAAVLPQFEVTGVLTTNAERAAMVRSFGVAVATDYTTLLAAKPDFVVASPSYNAVAEVIETLVDYDVAVLAETPPAPDLARLNALWQTAKKGRVQVAEQYLFQPEHAARLAIIASGVLGNVSHAQVSCAHGYHATSLIRHYLSLNFEPATIRAMRHKTPAMAGPGRGGPPTEATLVEATQTVATLDFGDKWALFDFAGEQYFSWIRNHRLLVRGERGEIQKDSVSYLLDHRTPVNLSFQRWDTGHGGNLEGYSHQGITLGSEWVYRNQFFDASLSDDEIAVATCLQKMGDYVRDGASFYSLAEAMQDTYLALCIEEAVVSGQPVTTARQAWMSEM